MSFTADDFNLAKSRMMSELNKAMSDAEDLRKVEAEASDGAAASARATVEALPGGAGAGVAGASGTAAGTTGETAGTADNSPTAIGVVTTAGK